MILCTGRELATGHEVWRDYAGVWHMNEDSGVAYDSTANGLDALPENYLLDIDVSTEMVYCGKATADKMPIINTTTNNSIRVKPRLLVMVNLLNKNPYTV